MAESRELDLSIELDEAEASAEDMVSDGEEDMPQVGGLTRQMEEHMRLSAPSSSSDRPLGFLEDNDQRNGHKSPSKTDMLPPMRKPQ